MQALARLSVNRPVVATVLVLVFAVVGIYSLPRLGVDRFPAVDIPYVTVITTLRGATPEEMETQVTEQIEKQVNTVSGIDTLSSTSSEGVSTVVIGFVLEKNGDIAAQEVRAKVDLVLAYLPKDVDKPIVQKFDSGSSAVIQLAVSSQDRSIRDLTEYVDKTMRPQIENVQGVGEAEILGGQARQINVELDAMALRAYKLTALEVGNALAAGNLQVPGGALDQGDKRISVRTRGRVTSIDGIRDLIIRVRDGHAIRLSDVARVSDAEEEAESVAKVDGKPAILVSIRKQSGANAVNTIAGVKTRLEQLQKTLPAGMDLRIVSDQSDYILAALRAVEEHLILGAILASIIVLVFLWNWRSAIIAAIAIPTSLVSTFALMSTMGFTLNVVTLLALTLAVGIVIDDAVIVIENIYRYLEEKQMSPREAALAATQEIGLAVLATTFSLIAVFVPISFMTGIVGRFFNSFGLTMAFAIMISLLVAFTLAPMLSARWLRKPKETLHAILRGDGLRGSSEAESPGAPAPRTSKAGAFSKLEGGYRNVLRWSLRHRWVVALMGAFIFFMIGPLGKASRVNFLPEDDEGVFAISVRAPEGTSLSKTSSILDKLAEQVRVLPEVDYTVVTIGSDRQRSQNSGAVTVHMRKVEERKQNVTQQEVMSRARAEIVGKYPRDLRIVVAAPDPMSGGTATAVQFVLTGPDLDKLTATADRMVKELTESGAAMDCDTSSITGKPEIGISVDRNAAADVGVGVSDVATTLRMLVAGTKVSDYAEGGYQYDINLRAMPQYRDREANLALFLVPSSSPGVGAIPLNQVVTSRPGSGPASINRFARNRQVTVSCNIPQGGSEQATQAKINEIFEKAKPGPLYQGQAAGRSRELGRTMTAFGTALLLAIVFMYLILAAQFESWVTPLVILTVLPLTMPFALLSVLLLRGSMNIFSMLGILVLFGVVMKNAILQVDHANGLRNEGMERDDAVIEACRDRLRPILMTTIAFVAGMIPLALSSGTGAGTNRAMSTVIIGGQLLSLAISLVAIPVYYTMMDDLMASLRRVKARILGRTGVAAAD
ncbi:MAG: efflux RND transporter permease subunit [Armatimonadetes bacterium]|nr:efflux RND transporter permease subunit [Armatimonadota bacterium]